MPEISYFYGIHIRLNFRDHAPPHVHVVYGEHEAQSALPTERLRPATFRVAPLAS